MKKSLFILLVILFSCYVARAQYYRNESGFLLGVNAEFKYPFGDFGDINKYGIGVNLSGKYLINRVIGLGFEAGYHSFKNKIESNVNVDQGLSCKIVPVLLEATFYIPTWDRTLLPYFGLHFGGYLTLLKIKQSSDMYGETNTSESINRFSIGGGPHAGLLIELTEFIKLDLKIKGDYIPSIKKEYKINDYNEGNLGFNKIIDVGASVGLLYTF